MMKKTTFSFLMLLTLLMGSSLIVSCSSDDDEDGGSVENASALLVGSWACVYQEWSEPGDVWSSTYDPSSKYFIQLNADMSGYMISGPDELFEISTSGSKKNFTWYVQSKGGKNYLKTSVYGGEEYQINKLNSSSLEMTWDDENYRIFCRFIKVGEK